MLPTDKDIEVIEILLCGSSANAKEHMAKKSDLEAEFGKISQQPTG
jgi:hypothetical protein